MITYPGMRSYLNVVAAIGLLLGGVFGMAGSVAASDTARAQAWAIDSVGLVVASSLLALRYFRLSKDLVAGGFLVFAIGEGVMLGGTAGSPASGIPTFGAGTALWSAALLLTSLPNEFAVWTRATGVIGSVLFGIVAARIFSGEALPATASPLPFFAYPFLVATFVGWILKILKRDPEPVENSI